MATRRQFIAAAGASSCMPAALPKPPNVIVLITDDQGYGDLSLHGNPNLKTPHLDRIGTEGIQFTRFHASPVCSPTRSSLMTGRYNYRTGVVDTYLGRSLMHADEVTLAECLAPAGYRTGIFGKWHLGDNYPLRAMDQGFQEALTLRGGGLAQPSSPPGAGYFDPPLEHNGRPVKGRGYCTDIFFDAAMEFISANRGSPFFTYLATNAPHDPLQVDGKWVEPYRAAGLDERTAKVYGMIANLDHNTGRLLDHLRRLDLERDTLLVFLGDNGPAFARYNAGMRGLKGTTYEGGLRVPCFMRWPARWPAGATDHRTAAHIDLLPTILDACGVRLPPGRTIDGRSLLRKPVQRNLFFQWHRGDSPEPMRNCAVLGRRWKLVGSASRQAELYDLQSDPAEKNNLAESRPGVTASLRRAYDRWFADIARDHGYAPPRIFIGAPRENPVLLTRQDWRGPAASWDAAGLGHYEVDVRASGQYTVTLRFPAVPADAGAEFRLGALTARSPVKQGDTQVVFARLALPAGPARLEGCLIRGQSVSGAHYIEVDRH
ncbi:MAG: arylsulfatase [Candidatus Solibacter usitatus]|nr:arylsulfatase [Candidatus Solibacter usitatus]